MEFKKEFIEDFFNSNGISKDTLNDFNKNQVLFHSLNDKAGRLQKDILELRKEVKTWVDHSQGGGQYKSTLANVNKIYPSIEPPTNQENDETYQEMYAIAHEYINGWKASIDKMQECLKICDKLENNILNNNSNQIHDQLAELYSITKNINTTKVQIESIFNKFFRRKFSTWRSDNPILDKLICDSQLSIKYPNGYIEWIPYEQFSNIELEGNGGFAIVYKANWGEGFGIWNYAIADTVESKIETHYGVLPYMAPELLRGDAYTQAADIYSIGMIMWFLVTKQNPFVDRAYDIHLALDICSGVRPIVPEGTPPDYKEWMLKCWSSNPLERPTSNDLYQK
ncbi:168_t:CDS:2, partial [Racocetra fulgida]